MRVVEDPLNRDTIQAITQLIVERFNPSKSSSSAAAPAAKQTKTAIWT